MKHTDLFYDLDNIEILSYSEKDEAIEMILDGCYPENMPRELELCTYKRSVVDSPPDYHTEGILETLTEFLDENYGGEENYEPTAEMKEETEKYVSKIFKLYVPWRCEIIKRENN